MTQAELASAAHVPQPDLSAYERGRRSPSPAVLTRLEQALQIPIAHRLDLHRDAICTIVAQHHATNPRVFGSVARDADSAASDLDLLVDFTGEASLLDEVGLRLALSDLLEVDVDVVGTDTLRGDLRERVMSQAVPL